MPQRPHEHAERQHAEQQHLDADELGERLQPRLRAAHRVLPLVQQRGEVVADVVDQDRERDHERDGHVQGVPDDPPPPVPGEDEAEEPGDDGEAGGVLAEDAAPEDDAAEEPEAERESGQPVVERRGASASPRRRAGFGSPSRSCTATSHARYSAQNISSGVSGVTSTAPNVNSGVKTTSGSRCRGRVSQPITARTVSVETTAGRRMAKSVSPNTAVAARIMYAVIGGWS